jgi:hypothetical protein
VNTSYSVSPAAVSAIAVAAPAIATFVPAQARAMMMAREVPASYEPRAFETAADPVMSPEPVMAASTQLLTEDPAPRSDLAQKRLFGTVPDDIEPYFDLFMYVSKARRGPLAQHMFIFQRDADGHIVPYADWKVSIQEKRGGEEDDLEADSCPGTGARPGVYPGPIGGCFGARGASRLDAAPGR